MIIVEGPDGSGKSTLIEQLAERYHLPIAPRVVSKDAEAMVDLKQWVEENVAMGWQDMIFDRHRLISETIYGPILRTTQEPGFNDWVWFSVNLWKFFEAQPIIIYCLPPLEVVRANIHGDHDNKVVWDSIDAVYTGYVTRAALDYENRQVHTIIWDYTTDGQEANPLQFFDQVINNRINRK